MNRFLTFLLLIFISTGMSAQDTVNIKELVITYQANKQTPVTYQDLKAKELDRISTGQEPSFILSGTPSMTVYSDAGSTQGYSYFRLRGIDQTRINFTIDGVPINEPEDQGAYFSNYPDIFNSVSKVQIQRGVGTTKNGSASYGGSLQLFSPSLHDSRKATLGTSYGSYNTHRVFGEFNSGVKDNFGFYGRVSRVHSDGYKYNSDNTSTSAFLSTGWYGKKSTWKLNGLIGNQQNGMAWMGVSDSLIAVDRRTNGNSEQERDDFTQALVYLQNSTQINTNSSLQSTLYYTYLNGRYTFDFNNFLGFPSTDELYGYTFRSDFTGFFTNYTYENDNVNWITGIHGNLYNRQHIGDEASLGELYRNTGYKNEASVFTKVNYTLNDFSFFVDLQYRTTNFTYEGAVAMPDFSWSFFNPKAGVAYNINRNTVAYYSIGSTGREPTRNDMFGGNDDLLADADGNALLFNTDLEQVTDQELGVRFRNGKVRTSANFFFMNFQNEIVLNGSFGPNGLALTSNVERSIRTGLEFSLNWRINSKLKWVTNASYNYSRITEQNVSFSPILTPPVIINQEFVLTNKPLEAAIGLRYQDASYIDFANSASIDAYVLLNARIGIRQDRWRGTIFVNNIFNKDYYNNGFVDWDGSHKYFVQLPLNVFGQITFDLF